MKIAILGYGGQGQSAYEHWGKDGNEVTICDQNAQLDVPSGAQTSLGTDHLKNLDQYDVLVRTPILHPREIVAANPDVPDILSKVTTVTNEFFRICPSKNIIGVTGTKGKGTTSTLIAKILEAAGKRVHLGGNIGIPPLELLKDDIRSDDWVVLELANFQLIDLKYSPPLAVCLMVEREHLDWHEDHEEYVSAKQQMFIHQNEDDIAIYYAGNENSESIADASTGSQIPYFAAPGAFIKDDTVEIDGQKICETNAIKLLGEHNWQNVCAAVTAVWQITQDVAAIRSVVTSFAGLPFRIEFRAEKKGIRYYNDSFAVTPAASSAAIRAITGKKVIIIGGYQRGSDLEELIHTLQEKSEEIRSVLLVGASAEQTATAFKHDGFLNFTVSTAKGMESIVSEATALAQTGDAVVLSPAFASFDMFKNFEERGKQFNEAVDEL